MTKCSYVTSWEWESVFDEADPDWNPREKGKIKLRDWLCKLESVILILLFILHRVSAEANIGTVLGGGGLLFWFLTFMFYFHSLGHLCYQLWRRCTHRRHCWDLGTQTKKHKQIIRQSVNKPKLYPDHLKIIPHCTENCLHTATSTAGQSRGVYNKQ